MSNCLHGPEANWICSLCRPDSNEPMECKKVSPPCGKLYELNDGTGAGYFVSISDYEQLQKENAALKGQLRAATEDLHAIKDAMQNPSRELTKHESGTRDLKAVLYGKRKMPSYEAIDDWIWGEGHDELHQIGGVSTIHDALKQFGDFE